MSFTVYALENCPYSIKAVKLMEKYQIPTDNVKWISSGNKEKIKRKYGFSTFPHILYKGKSVGGCHEFEKLLSVAKTMNKYGLTFPMVRAVSGNV
jgi:glutaredoxin